MKKRLRLKDNYHNFPFVPIDLSFLLLAFFFVVYCFYCLSPDVPIGVPTGIPTAVPTG